MSSWFAGIRLRLMGGALACAAACAFASPSSSAPDTLELPEARATGRAAPAADAGVYRLDAAALRRFATLEEALDALPGFRVRRQGGLGGYSELSFRGARASQVDIYVDGIRLNQDGDATPDLAKWPLLWFTSLEARSAPDDRGGSPGALARIDLSTRDDGRANFQARVGSFSTVEVAASAQAPVGAGWILSAGLQGQGARNDYPFFSDNGTAYNKADDGVWRMDNNAYQSRGARAAARREGAESRQTVSALWLDSRKEYPGLFPSSARAYGLRDEWMGAWRLEHFEGPLPWETGFQARRVEDAYRDPGQSLGYLSYESARVSTAAEADAALRARPAPPLGARADLRLRAEETKPRVTSHSDGRSSPDATRGEAQAGLALDLDLSGTLPGLSAHGEIRQALVRFRAEDLRGYADTGANGGAGLSAGSDRHPAALRAALQWSRRAQTAALQGRIEQRAPTSGELLGDNLGILAKLDLRPEEARSLSLVHTVTWVPKPESPAPSPRLALQSTLFWNTYLDPIRLKAHGASAFMRYENDAAYRSVGLETQAALVTRHTESLLSANLQEASILEGPYRGNQPVYQSPLEAHAETFVTTATGSRTQARVGLLADFRSAYYPGDANLPDSRRSAEWELGAHASAGRGPWKAAFDARNLTDRHYRDFAYSPRSGRGYALSLSFDL